MSFGSMCNNTIFFYLKNDFNYLVVYVFTDNKLKPSPQQEPDQKTQTENSNR